MAPEQQRRQCRRQRQGVDRGDHGRDRDRQRELLVELPGEAGDEGEGNEYRNQDQCDRDDGAGDLPHCLVGGVSRRQPGLDVALDVLDHDDSVVDDDADREHQTEQAERIDGEAEHVHHGECADDRHRHRQERNDGSPPGLEEQDDHQYHQRDRFQQRVDHRLDRRAHELCGVVDDLVGYALGHVLLDLGHGGADVVGDLERVGARCLEDRDRHRLFVVEQRAQAVSGRT